VLLGANGKLTEHFHSQNFYFRQKLPFSGASFNVDFENARQSTSNPFTSLSPYLNSRLVLSFTQPLLRNRLVDRERAEIQVRRKQLDVSEAEFEARMIDVITRVEQAYWDLVAVRQDAAVKRENVDWAQRLLEQNKRMIAAGTLASVELAASEAELERRLDTWYSSLGVVTEVENVLKSMLTNSRAAELWSDEIVPIEEKTLEPPAADDLRVAVSQALQRRPEMRVIGLRQESNEIQKKFNADQTKPQVNLVASYGNAGLGGTLSTTPNPFATSQAESFQRLNDLSARVGLPPLSPPSFGGVPDLLVGGYGTALANLFRGRFQTFQVGIAFDLTLRNRTAEAGLAQSVIAERRLRLEQARVEQAIEVQVRNALQGIQTAHQRITAGEASARAAKEKLDSETRLFEAGESTNFLVLTRQNEYADSRRRAVAARLDLNKAVARLEQALGTTLAVHQVQVK
jgi:HAE1 family hydrophobic/amphiphilic exporter-1